MSPDDPRRRKAEQLRDQVLEVLKSGPRDTDSLYRCVRNRVLHYVDAVQLEYALATLRKSGRVRWSERRWELCNP